MQMTKTKRESIRRMKKRKSPWYCDCDLCIGDAWKRFVEKTRCRAKFRKYPKKILEEE